jgi:hypothetical protein
VRIEFLDKQDDYNPLNGSTFVNAQDLARTLDELRFRRPFGLELIAENGFSLDICLAENFGSMQHTASDGGTATPVATRYCLSYDLVKQIAVHFFKTGDRDPDVLWEQI